MHYRAMRLTLRRYDTSMCSHYQAIKELERYRRHFGVEPPHDLGKFEMACVTRSAQVPLTQHVSVGRMALRPPKKDLTCRAITLSTSRGVLSR